MLFQRTSWRIAFPTLKREIYKVELCFDSMEIIKELFWNLKTEDEIINEERREGSFLLNFSSFSSWTKISLVLFLQYIQTFKIRQKWRSSSCFQVVKNETQHPWKSHALQLRDWKWKTIPWFWIKPNSQIPYFKLTIQDDQIYNFSNIKCCNFQN